VGSRHFVRGRLTALLLLSSFAAAQQNAVVPSTTLANETSNNTSAAQTFTGTSNGNMAAGNVSKASIQSLLYPGSTTKIYAHLMAWFNPKSTSHIKVGYSSSDPAQVHRQITDMMSRGISGVTIDWYGPGNTFIDSATKAVKAEAESQGAGFTFAIMEDGGALSSCANTSGCDVTQKFINDLNYAYNTYVGSPSYLRINGHPAYFTFGTESFKLDWTRVQAGLLGSPVFIPENSGGFTLPMSSGAFAWDQAPTVTATDPIALKYLNNFYSTGLKYPALTPFGAAYKGFDDSIASWGADKYMAQQCGQTWLQTLADASNYFSANRQLAYMQLVTWNDYEEGTAIEPGVDNCVSVSGSVASGVLNWSISGGQENTIDHYAVFISSDGQNLMKIIDVPAGQHSLNIDSYNFVAAPYSLFVEALGKASIANKMSTAISYTAPAIAPTAAVNVSYSRQIAPAIVQADTSASVANSGSIASSTIDWGDGTTSTGPIAGHTYSAAGIFTVTATVTNSYGLSSSTTAASTVKPNIPPIASLALSATQGVGPLTITANAANSTAPNGSVASTVINWGDGTSSTAVTASHTYTNVGTYAVTATVTDNVGSTGTASATVNVFAPASVAILSPGNGASIGLNTTVSAQGTSGYAITAMQLSLDGTVVAQSSANPMSASLNLAPGIHTLTALLTDSSGAVAQQSISFTAVNQAPKAALSVSASSWTAPSTVSASASGSSDADGSIVSSSINWGDGTTSNSASASKVYNLPGTYTVTATVTDNYGATSTASQTITVTAPAARSIQVISPQPGTVAGTNVHMQANGFSPNPVTTMQVYVDNVLKYQIKAPMVDTYLTLTTGSHNVVFQGWDANGSWKQAVSITVTN
jgi:PKD repeat protein